MNKKHFIILGRVGLIYFSWLLVMLFISLILVYEATRMTFIIAAILGLIFILLLLYTYFTSYWDNSYFKLPFKSKSTITSQPKLIRSWFVLEFYQIKLSDLENYYLLRFNKPE
ncbi:acyltransferase [Lactobacillus sp. ESL0681]|uniref:acyltransferase n=1 Tax=Lactobacillus sp. ESL0681 TaxID=2983211 RepID=UPI0023F6A32F|nr:acyltransferase [Lactobacillus sp. ESL0681]WEV40678.1 acyltransferase [Lactobacillus sp. ESL0681]